MKKKMCVQDVDVELEWLSVFVEDCFSSQASCLLEPPNVHQATTTTSKKPSQPLQIAHQNESPTKFAVPGKARSKRKRLSAPRAKDPLSIWSHQLNPQNEAITSDPPLLKQAYWLADSELIIPEKKKAKEEGIKEEEENEGEMEKMVMVEKESESEVSNGQNPMPRRCSHCLAQRTPQWRAGPLGPKTLCNACGVRYKSGRLLPEYRPAKSPTFVSYLHSNSHKKVMEMRMSLPSIPRAREH